MFDVNNFWMEFRCPRCNYTIDIQLIDVKSEKETICNNCKTPIQLVDESASTHNAINTMNKTIEKIKNLF